MPNAVRRGWGREICDDGRAGGRGSARGWLRRRPGQRVERGLEQRRAEAHNGSEQVFDAAFDPQKQLNQIEDAITSQKFDAFVISAVDGVGVMPAIRHAAEADIKVVADTVALGPDMSNANFVAQPWGNDLEAYTIALANALAGARAASAGR